MKSKKVLALTLSVFLAAGIAACGSSKEETASSSTGMANPVEELSSLEELSERIDAALIKPEGFTITDEVWSVINGDDPIGEYQFTADGVACSLRVAHLPATTDISGYYTADQKTIYEDSDTEDTGWNQTDDFQSVRWFTIDGQYVLIAEDAGSWDSEKFESLQIQFENTEPRNWDSDVPFDDYKVLKGYYIDDEQCLAFAGIKGCCMQVLVSVQTDDGTVNWTADCVLKDDQLVYDEAKLELVEFDDETFDVTYTPYGEESSGSIEISDGNLNFSGVDSELVAGKVFKPYNRYEGN